MDAPFSLLKQQNIMKMFRFSEFIFLYNLDYRELNISQIGSPLLSGVSLISTSHSRRPARFPSVTLKLLFSVYTSFSCSSSHFDLFFSFLCFSSFSWCFLQFHQHFPKDFLFLRCCTKTSFFPV